MRAIPADKNFIPKDQQFIHQDLFNQLSSSWKQKSNADKSFFEKDFAQKRDALRKLALQPELEDILDVMSNESIVYDTELTYFAEPYVEIQELNDIKKEFKEQIEEKMSSSFARHFFRCDSDAKASAPSIVLLDHSLQDTYRLVRLWSYNQSYSFSLDWFVGMDHIELVDKHAIAIGDIWHILIPLAVEHILRAPAFGTHYSSTVFKPIDRNTLDWLAFFQSNLKSLHPTLLSI
jgi:hypothetical protein